LKIKNPNKKFQLLFSNCGIGGSEIGKSKIKIKVEIQNENIKFNLLFSNCGSEI